MIDSFLVAPFTEFAFMRRALAGVVALSIAGAPMGVLLMLRRMSLTGDGMSHAILPGTALAYAFFGMSVWPLSIGGLVAGLAVALMAGGLSRFTALKEDASLAAFYLISLALGVMIVSSSGTQVDLMHFLFGSILALDNATLLLVAAVASITVLALALIWRPLLLDGIDPGFLRTVSGTGTAVYMAYMALLVLNLVASFHALGTLLSVGYLVLPAVIARFWTRDINLMLAIAIGSSLAAGASGLIASYHLSLPTGPAMILSLGLLLVLSVVFGRVEGVVTQLRPGLTGQLSGASGRVPPRLGAGSAQARHLDGRPPRLEAGRLNQRAQGRGDLRDVLLLHVATGLADQEGAAVVPRLAAAGHESAECLDAMGQPLAHQLVERAVDGGRRADAVVLQPMKQFVGRQGLAAVAQQRQHLVLDGDSSRLLRMIIGGVLGHRSLRPAGVMLLQGQGRSRLGRSPENRQ